MQNSRHFTLAALVAAFMASTSAVLAEDAADTVFRNGLVYTVDATNTVSQALAVSKGKIIAVGSNEAVAALIGKATKVIDLGGKVLMPGLIDGHMHPMGGGAQLTSCSLNYLSLTTDEALTKITECLESDKGAPAGSWLQVQGWFRQAMTPAGADLTAAILDKLSTDRPVIVFGTDFHSMAANTAALKAAGITADTPDPSDGSIQRDDKHVATGILLDGAMWMVAAKAPALPPDVQKTKDKADLEAALAALRKQGVTQILDAAASPDTIALFQKFMQDGALTLRANFAVVISADETLNPTAAVAAIKKLGETYNTPQDSVTPGLSVRTAKVFLDGVIQAPAQTGALMEPYLKNVGTEQLPNWQKSDNSGALYVKEPQLISVMEELMANGLNIHMHSDGDQAVHVSLNAIAAARAKYPKADFRPAVAHCELMLSSDYHRFAELGALPVLSFQWAKPAPDTVNSVKDYVGAERFNYIETAGKFNEKGARIVYGSDWPVDALNEWFAMEVAVTRSNEPATDALYQGRLGDDPGLDIKTAIRSFTINAAYSLHMENYVGSLEVGKLADLIVIDQDLLTVASKAISDTKVLMTMVGGKQVYRAEGFVAP